MNLINSIKFVYNKAKSIESYYKAAHYWKKRMPLRMWIKITPALWQMFLAYYKIEKTLKKLGENKLVIKE